jgi:hypothetical protein
MVFVAYWCLQAPHPCIRMSSIQLNTHKTNGVCSLLGLAGASSMHTHVIHTIKHAQDKNAVCSLLGLAGTLPMYTNVDTYQDART